MVPPEVQSADITATRYFFDFLCLADVGQKGLSLWAGQEVLEEKVLLRVQGNLINAWMTQLKAMTDIVRVLREIPRRLWLPDLCRPDLVLRLRVLISSSLAACRL